MKTLKSMSDHESVLKEAYRLWRCVEDDVKEPYRSKYKASEMLDELSRTHSNETIRNLLREEER